VGEGIKIKCISLIILLIILDLLRSVRMFLSLSVAPPGAAETETAQIRLCSLNHRLGDARVRLVIFSFFLGRLRGWPRIFRIDPGGGKVIKKRHGTRVKVEIKTLIEKLLE
jgi:hypothetical protein